MTIQQIYDKFNLPINLQEHMLRVASLSKIICDNWTGENINQSEIIKACLLHDIAKPVAFDNSIENLAKYKIPAEHQVKLIDLQNFIKANYGEDEHVAASSMSRDVGLSKKGIKILDNIEWHFIPRLMVENNMESLIAIYCDMRVSPNGIMSIKERIENLLSRYTQNKYDYESFRKNGPTLEQKIQSNVNIDLSSIKDEEVNSLFSYLRTLEI